MLVIDQQCELPGVKEVVTTESWQVLIKHVSQHAISRNQCELWFQSLTHICKGCICSPREELEVVLQQPQNNHLLLCYKGCTPLLASANQLTTETSLWAYPCCVDTIVHRQLGCSAYAASGGLSASFCSRQPFLALIYTTLGDGPQVVKSESGSKHNFLQQSQEISS